MVMPVLQLAYNADATPVIAQDPKFKPIATEIKKKTR